MLKMPRFQIKRKTREPEPEVVPEEKIDEEEVSLESETVSDSESEPLEQQMEALGLAARPRRHVEYESEPQYAPQRRQREAIVGRYPSEVDRQEALRQYRQHMARQELQARRSAQYARSKLAL